MLGVFYTHQLRPGDVMQKDTFQDQLVLVMTLAAEEHVFKKILLKLLRVNPNTFNVWRKRHNMPIGLVKSRTQFVLEYLGFEVQALTLLQRPIYTFAKHVAFDLCPMAKAIDLLEVSQDHIMRLVGGMRPASADKLELVELYLEENKTDLDKFEASIQFSPSILSKINHQLERTMSIAWDDELKEQTPKGNKKTVVNSFIKLVRELNPIASQLASNDFSSEEREIIRNTLGRHAVFTLKNNLIKLCSERARTLMEYENESVE